MPHKAIWVDSGNELSIREIKDNYVPQKAETLIKVSFSGINPADLKHAIYLGVNDNVAGYDFSGTVVQPGPGSRFKAGDRVAGLTPAMNPRPYKNGSHQQYLIAPDLMVFPVPEHMAMDLAATLGVAIRTAIDALCCVLGLPEPGSNSENPGPLLIWGGASGVGTAAIQVAAAARISPILVTASPQNHKVLQKLGATECFNYRDEDVVEQIKSLISKSGKSLDYAFDTIGNVGYAHMADLCFASCSEGAKVVSTIPHGKALGCFATTSNDFSFESVNGTVTFAARIADAERTSRISESVVMSLKSLSMPVLKTVDGYEAGIEAIQKSAQGTASFEKAVVAHENIV
jgi:NADPH:quinone reductase-like Zn-dependent oxidoreductase